MVTTRRSRRSNWGSAATPELEAPKRHTTSISFSTAQKLKASFSSPTTSTSTTLSTKPTSVFLEDWWLIKASDEDLGIGGFASRASLGVRGFRSAAVAKRHCGTVLETTDGITVTISGLINTSRTHQNGFPAEVCNQFLLGFPYNWEEYSACRLGKEPTDLGASMRTSASDESNIFSGKAGNNSSLPSLNDLPVTTVRDLLLSTFGHPDYDLILNNIHNDTLRTSKNGTSTNSGAPTDSNMENKKDLVCNGKSGLNAIAEKKGKTENCRQLKSSVSVPRLCVVTRSMSRMQLRSKRTKNEDEEWKMI